MTYYQDLGVARSASQQEIDDRYLELREVLHPDRGGDRSVHAAVEAAYRVLGDPETRRAYDRELPPEPPPRDRPSRYQYEIPSPEPSGYFQRWVRKMERRHQIQSQMAKYFVAGAAMSAPLALLTTSPLVGILAGGLVVMYVGPPLVKFLTVGRRPD